MRKLYNDYAGSYLPAFFFLDIETTQPLDNLDQLPVEDQSVLFHEYVHFMQDVTTIFGLINISHTVDIQKTINDKILNDTQPTLQLPISIDDIPTSEINLNLFSLYQGDYERDMEQIDHIETIFLEENDYVAGFETVPAVIVQAMDIKGMPEFFSFGAVCVMESMAHLIQDRLFDNVEPTVFPYLTAKEVCKYLYPELAEDNLNVIILCDIALNAAHPGKFFYDLILEMKKQQFVPVDYTDFYGFLERYRITDLQGASWSFYDMFKKQADLAKNQLKDYFTIPLYDDIRVWIEQIINLGVDFRIKNIAFWLDILDWPTKEERRDAFRALTNVFGFPLMTNLQHNYYFHHPVIIPERIVSLKAIHEINQILFFGQQGCGMKDFCRQGKDITSPLCEEPWKRAKEEQLCPFGQIWKMWGLSEKTPVY